MACYVLLGTETRKTVVGMTLLTLPEILVMHAVRLGQAREDWITWPLISSTECLLQRYDI
jgi:hypothetical protein